LVACSHMQTKRSLEMLKRGEEEDRAGRRWYRRVENGQNVLA
jgi:hypothetical protein